MFNRFYPNEYFDSIFLIDYDKLLKMGIKYLIYDIDNTLVPFDVKEAPKKIIDLFSSLKEKGFQICLLSNNNARRVNDFNVSLQLHNVSRARKPFLHGINKAMNLLGSTVESTCLIGDQIFTDVWCGNRKKIHTILVKPTSDKDEITVKLKRGIERIVVKKYLKYLKK